MLLAGIRHSRLACTIYKALYLYHHWLYLVPLLVADAAILAKLSSYFLSVSRCIKLLMFRTGQAACVHCKVVVTGSCHCSQYKTDIAL